MDAVEVALAIPVRGGRVLVRRRASGVHLAGSWEFPGGKIDPDEDPAAAARRELREETELCGGEVEPLLVHAFDYDDRSVRLHVYVIHEPMGEASPTGDGGWSWVAIDDLEALDMPAANGPIVRALRWRLVS